LLLKPDVVTHKGGLSNWSYWRKKLQANNKSYVHYKICL